MVTEVKLHYFRGRGSTTAVAVKIFSRHIEVSLYNAKLNQTSRKPKISPQIAVIAGFQVTSAACENFAGSTGDCENQLSQLIGSEILGFPPV